jgi:hypothetical protein
MLAHGRIAKRLSWPCLVPLVRLPRSRLIDRTSAGLDGSGATGLVGRRTSAGLMGHPHAPWHYVNIVHVQSVLTLCKRHLQTTVKVTPL